MRAVEQQPWAERRSSKHDGLCLLIASHPERIFPNCKAEVRTKIEAPIGRGFVDVLAWTDAPANDREIALIEAKTNDERTSAGDIIRQLRWYRQQLGRPARLVLVVEDLWDAPSEMIELIAMAGVEILPASYFMEAA